MSAHDNWSNSDSENESALTDVETAVELGIPNGEITSTEDLGDPMVSRIGGIPVRLQVSFAFECPVLNLLISLFLMHIPISTNSCSFRTLCVSHSFPNLHLHSIPRIAKFACRLRSCWSNCGVLYRIALMIGCYTCGAAHGEDARRRTAGKLHDSSAPINELKLLLDCPITPLI